MKIVPIHEIYFHFETTARKNIFYVRFLRHFRDTIVAHYCVSTFSSTLDQNSFVVFYLFSSSFFSFFFGTVDELTAARKKLSVLVARKSRLFRMHCVLRSPWFRGKLRLKRSRGKKELSVSPMEVPSSRIHAWKWSVFSSLLFFDPRLVPEFRD